MMIEWIFHHPGTTIVLLAWLAFGLPMVLTTIQDRKRWREFNKRYGRKS